MPYPNVEDVLLKSRMRENLTSGSVRGLIATSEPLLHQEVGYELYSTVTAKNVGFKSRALLDYL
jgi:hypothetical protein